MKIRWIGHASFHIETEDGLRIRTDPYDASIGLPLSRLQADVVTVSHDHSDHNAAATVPGKPAVLRGPGTRTVRGVTFCAVATYHDDSRGSKRGPNAVFSIRAEGIAVVHLGDLGHPLGKEQVEALGQVDILLVPVGGVYTIDAAQAATLATALKARIVVPMHYKIPGLSVAVGGIEPFLKGKSNVRHADEITVSEGSLPERQEIVVLPPRP